MSYRDDATVFYELLTSAHVGFVGGTVRMGYHRLLIPGATKRSAPGPGARADVAPLQAKRNDPRARDPYPENLEAHRVCFDARITHSGWVCMRRMPNKISTTHNGDMGKRRTAVGATDAGGARSPRSYAAARDFVPETTRTARRADALPTSRPTHRDRARSPK